MKFFIVKGTDKENNRVIELFYCFDLSTAYELANDLDIDIESVKQTNKKEGSLYHG